MVFVRTLLFHLGGDDAPFGFIPIGLDFVFGLLKQGFLMRGERKRMRRGGCRGDEQTAVEQLTTEGGLGKAADGGGTVDGRARGASTRGRRTSG